MTGKDPATQGEARLQDSRSWTVEATNQFVWVQRYEGGKSWEEQDQAYFASDERRAMDPDPARLIARMEQYFAEPVEVQHV